MFALCAIVLALTTVATLSHTSVRCERTGQQMLCTAITARPLFNSSITARVSSERAAHMQFVSDDAALSTATDWIAAVNRGVVLTPSAGVLVFDGRTFRDYISAPTRRGMWRRDGAADAARAVFEEHTSEQFAFYQVDSVAGGRAMGVVFGALALLVALCAMGIVYVLYKKSLFFTVTVDSETQTIHSRRWRQQPVIVVLRDGRTAMSVLVNGNETTLVATGGNSGQQVIAGPLKGAKDFLPRLQRKIQSALDGTKIVRENPRSQQVLRVAALVLAVLFPVGALLKVTMFLSVLPDNGTIEVRSTTERCGVGGMTLLPGGATQWIEPVGAQLLAATQANGSIIRVRYDIEPHRKTVLRCEDINRALEPTNREEYGIFVTPSTGAFIVAPPVEQTPRTLPNEP